MSSCNEKHHENHPHQHGKGCGHTAIRHGDHVDYLHDGHLHHPHGDHVDEHILEVSEKNPDGLSTPRLLAVLGVRMFSWTVLLCDAELPTVHFRA
ncbi:TPA: hypothetical protein N3A33_004391, partial [Salmonella enterica subsp. salamae serovar 28:r:e,n,z15]|nr:hypothetical protein [Salmonella enterica subsp. salamae serovar 28:r:e,n,z15]